MNLMQAGSIQTYLSPLAIPLLSNDQLLGNDTLCGGLLLSQLSVQAQPPDSLFAGVVGYLEDKGI